MDQPLQPEQILQSRYRILALLGKGGMGAVYHAWDNRLNIPVAIKEMIPQPGLGEQMLAQLYQQFQQEAMVLARLNHPHLVRVTDFFEESDKVYLVMDYVEGESMAKLIERVGPLPEPQVVNWISQLLSALSYCHSRGALHRDIKPQNVIIHSEGGAVLVDFGLVKLWNPNDPRTKTAMRGMGTPEYAPPEQYDAVGGHTDARSDIYGIGATLYHALTGRVPPTATMRIVNPASMASVRSLNPGVSQRAEKAVLKALELQPTARFASAAEMRAALGGQAVAQAARPRPTPPPATVKIKASRPAAPAQSKRAPVWGWGLAGAAVVVAVIGVILLGAVFGQVTGRAPTRTPRIEPTATTRFIPTFTATPTAKPLATVTSVPSATLTFVPSSTSPATPTLRPSNTPRPTSTATRPRPTATPQRVHPTPTLAPSVPPTSLPQPTEPPPPPPPPATNPPPPP